MARTLAPILVLALALGCAPTSHELVVQVVSDMTPLVDFDEIRVEAPSGSAPERIPARAGAGYGRGARLLSRSASEGPVLVTVSFARRGVEIVRAQRRTRVVGATTVLTIRVSRECIGVTCSDSLASACLAGRCVPDDCTPETPEACPPGECGVTGGGATCTPTPVVCAQTACSPEGVCVDEPRDDRCATGEVCDTALSCVAVDVVGPLDAGADDGGPVDATPYDSGVMPSPIVPRWAAVSNGQIQGFVTGLAANNGLVFLEAGCEAGDDFGAGPVTGFGGPDVCVAAYDGTLGTPIWSRALGSIGAEQGGGLAATGAEVFATYSYFTAHDVAPLLGPGAARGAGDLAVVRMHGTNGTPELAVRVGTAGFGDEYPGPATLTGDGRLLVFAGVPETGITAPFIPYFAALDLVSGAAPVDVLVSGARMLTPGTAAAGAGISLVGPYASGDFGDGVPAGAGASRSFVARFDLSGVIGWTRLVTSSRGVLATDVAEVAGAVFVTGRFGGDAHLGTLDLAGPSVAPAFDAFVAGINGDGSPGWLVLAGERISLAPHLSSSALALYVAAAVEAGGTIGGTPVGATPALGIAGFLMGGGTISSTLVVPMPVAPVVYATAFDRSSSLLFVAVMTSSPFDFAGTHHDVSGVSSVVLAFSLP